MSTPRAVHTNRSRTFRPETYRDATGTLIEVDAPTCDASVPDTIDLIVVARKSAPSDFEGLRVRQPTILSRGLLRLCSMTVQICPRARWQNCRKQNKVMNQRWP